MANSLWRQHIFPFSLALGVLLAAALIGDYLLHRMNLVWVGRYLGIPGTLLILLSLVYSLRKRKYIAIGNPKSLLALHEFAAWLGSLLVLVHAGVHFSAILPWLATLALGVNLVSGLVGKILLVRARQHVQEERGELARRGLSPADIEQAMFWDAVTLNVMNNWRKVHIPIFFIFAILALIHIISILIFWSWV